MPFPFQPPGGDPAAAAAAADPSRPRSGRVDKPVDQQAFARLLLLLLLLLHLLLRLLHRGGGPGPEVGLLAGEAPAEGDA